MKTGWNWLLARLNRTLRRQRRAEPVIVNGLSEPAPRPRALEPGLIEAGEDLPPRRMVEVAPGRFVNERSLKRLREAGL